MHAYIHIFCIPQTEVLQGEAGRRKDKKSGKCLFFPKEGFARSGLCYLNFANGNFELASHDSTHLGKFCKEHKEKLA